MSQQIGTDCTESRAKQIAQDSVEYRIDELIEPSDVQDDAERWEDIERHTVEKECHESVGIMILESQQPIYDLVRQYALILWRDSMPRVKREHLKTDSEQEIVVSHGYWPFDMTYYDVYQVLNSYVNEHGIHEIPNGCWQEAKGVITNGYVLGMLPECHKPNGDDN